MTALSRKTITIITLLCVLMHSLGACCAFAHVACSHAAVGHAENCADDCCHRDSSQSSQGEHDGHCPAPCGDHDHDHCDHCGGGCFLVIVSNVSALDLLDGLPVMTVAFDVAAMDRVANGPCFAADEGEHSFVRFNTPIFSQNQTLLI